MLARRLLVESAWQYAREPRVGATLRNRQNGQPDHILQISNRAQQRLHHLYTSMRARGKPHNVTVVAVAREGALLSVGRRHRPLTPFLSPEQQLPGSGGRDAGPTQRPARAMRAMSSPTRPRSFLDQRTAGGSNRAMGYDQIPAFQTGNAVTEPDVPPSPDNPAATPTRAFDGETSAYRLDKRCAISAVGEQADAQKAAGGAVLL